MIEKLKLEESENVKDQPLPESILWDSISDAPQSVKDLNYTDGVKLESIDEDGRFTEDVINARLNTQTQRILAEFQFQDSGALAMKTDANNGLWLSPTGILGKKSGATTFAIDTGGNATFSGSVVSATITSSTITGGTIRTASSGTRVQMTGADNRLDVYSGSTLRMSLDEDSLEFFNPSGTNMSRITATSTLGFHIDASGASYSGWTFNSSYGIYFTGSAVVCLIYNGGLAMQNSAVLGTYDIRPVSGTPDIGSSGTPYGTVYTNDLYVYDDIELYDNLYMNNTSGQIIYMSGGKIQGVDDIFLNGMSSSPTVTGQLRYYSSGGTYGLRFKIPGYTLQFQADLV